MPTNPNDKAPKKAISHLSDLPWTAPVPWEKMSPEEQTIVGRMIDRRLPELSPDRHQEACEKYFALLRILIGRAKRETELDQRLLEEPDGFDPGPGYTCGYCPAPATWYNKWKQTCARCYTAFLTGCYPPFVATHPESFFKRCDLERDLGFTSKQLNKLVERGHLVARHDIFLKKENPHLHRGPKPSQRVC